MNPTLNSALTTVLIIAFTNLGTVLVTKGYVGTSDVATLAAAAATITLYAASAFFGWYKTRQVTPVALIAAVNKGDNGVRVVSASVPEAVAPTVTQPIKGAAAS